MWDFLLRLQSYFLWLFLSVLILLVVVIFVAALFVKTNESSDGDKGDTDDDG